MQQFILVAGIHFLALLSPGPDFFLIARTALAGGWRRATGVCLGIALANGACIALAFGGLSLLRPGSTLFVVLQGAGALYLLHLGHLFVRHAGQAALRHDAMAGGTAGPAPSGPSWRQGLGMGLLSGMLNPKNALFYASLAAMLAGTGTPAWRLACGLWMFCAVLGWDLLVALAIGHRAVLARFSRWLPALERITGAALVLLALAMLGSLAFAVAG
ncbi:LysE family translocator [Pseudothauera rhizosphaerae]|uniref:LysE family translocator n=1 Tax=Pseudothauera rhizosphaerae TaxID=2565932 RepID=A0A4S4AR92_9RHOO|nr:LysE family translocator [Pseudothauera rhizosphaerae]